MEAGQCEGGGSEARLVRCEGDGRAQAVRSGVEVRGWRWEEGRRGREGRWPDKKGREGGVCRCRVGAGPGRGSRGGEVGVQGAARCGDGREP